jgi:hypothetical protein
MIVSVGCEQEITDRDIENQEEVVETAKVKAKAEKRELDAMNARRAVEGQLENDLQALDAKIDSLEARAEQAEGESKDEFQRDAAALRQSYDGAQKKLDELKAASDDNWEVMKMAVEKMRDELRQAIQTTTDRWNNA